MEYIRLFTQIIFKIKRSRAYMYDVYTDYMRINNTHIRLVIVSDSELLLRSRPMRNGIGLAYHRFNFLVGLHYYTTNTICLCHETFTK